MKKILLSVIFVFLSLIGYAQCTITASTNASALTCGTAPLSACNGILTIGNGTTPITLSMNATLDLTCLGAIQVIVNNASLDFSSGNNRLYLGDGSSMTFTNGGTLVGGSCNASERIYVGTNLLATCNGGSGADVTFDTLVNLGGTGSLTSNSPVCSGNAINLSATPPPSGGPYTYSWSGPGLTATAYASASTYSLVATNTNGGVYQVKMKSANGTIMIAEITVTVNTGVSTATPTVTTTQPGCTANGSITITAPTGTGMKYSINGLTYTNTTGVFTSLAAGTYSVTAKNSSGCISAATTVTLTQSTNTWDGNVWSAGAPTGSQKLVFSGDYASTGNISGCSCMVTAGNVVFNSGDSLILTNDIKVTGSGSITFDDSASLVQTNDAAVNTGNITYKRMTSPLKLYDYTYWSSPVANATLSQLVTNSVFYSFNPSINNWVYQYGSATMTPGVGYIGSTPDDFGSANILQTFFTGVPNNGVINTSIIKSAAGGYNLIGNPYPSAIDIDLFLTDAANSAVVNGTIYLWTHHTSMTNNVYTVNDYAKYNNTGGVKTASAAVSGGAVPTNKIGAGQGFFIEANTAKANGTYTATFKNSMRLTGNNTQFFKTNNAASNQGLEKHRIWLSLSNSQGAYNEMLVGYVQGATNGFDSMFDGKTLPVGNSVGIYTKVDNYDLSIQGKSLPFTDTDVIPIAYSTTLNGELTINLENYDGLFDNQNIYILDKVTNIYHDIKEGNFTFSTVSGTFEDRFELRFTNTALGTVTPDYDASVIVVNNHQQLNILSDASPVKAVEVFDILGKQLYAQNGLSTNNFQTGNISTTTQVVLVKITLENNVTVIKKTLIN
ncbi:T9SS sorting signal type C domain-containing protein [Flavobacterium sp. XGLA_31]|uniref:T9SS sorting signal type C domain-containing protein n=1 Tax=Flavobacterium sp. XGLA_31 TaxID=3447666 RepID=UPI003F3A38D4